MNNPLVQLDPGLFVWTILTFLLLVFILAKFAWKPLLKMLQDREDMVRSSLEDAEKAKSELERLNEESEAIMAKARSEAQSILADGKVAAEKVKDKAISEIKKEVVNLTLSVAEKLIQKNLSDADNKSLIEESLKKVQTYEA